MPGVPESSRGPITYVGTAPQLILASPAAPPAAFSATMDDDGAGNANVFIYAHAAGNGKVALNMNDGAEDGYLAFDSTALGGGVLQVGSRAGIAAATPILDVQRDFVSVFQVHADGSLHGLTGKALTFDL